MARVYVKSLSNHPYNGQMRAKGSKYYVESAEELKILKDLGRAEALSKEEEDEDRKKAEAQQTYRTREMGAQGQAGIMGTRGTVPVQSGASAEEVAGARADAEGKRKPAAAPKKAAGKSDSDK